MVNVRPILPRRVARLATELLLTWEDTASVNGYAVYRGDVGSYYGHGDVGACAVGMPSAQLSLDPGSLYYLVVGRNCDVDESSTGRDSLGTDRPAASPSCP